MENLIFLSSLHTFIPGTFILKKSLLFSVLHLGMSKGHS